MKHASSLYALVPLSLLALSGCGGGASTEENPDITGPSQPQYTGPAPATADVQAFRINLWDNINSSNRCGGCHGAGGQTPTFARTDDINLAYEAANGIVHLSDPPSSRMVQKVAGGHNCWLSSSAACADLLTVWIRNWAGSSASGGTQIQLIAPPLREVGSSRSFPVSAPASYAPVHNLLTEFCSGCHSSSATAAQSPFFAAGDIDESYEAVKQKINLDEPATSRLVVRLRNEFHNCWAIPTGGSPNCQGSADTMQEAIETMLMASEFQPVPVDPSLILSKALSLYDGTVASGGNRFDSNVIAKWEFKTGLGITAFDTSGVEPAINLTFSGDVTWVGGWGINVRGGGKAQGSTAASRKLHSLITATGEYSVELWVAPGNVAQADAYMVSYSGGNAARNFTVAQQQYQLDFANRSSATDANGSPSLVTTAEDEDLQATLQHVVVTFDPVNGRRVYVNGENTGEIDFTSGANLSDWDNSFALVLGNETSSNRPFTGVFRMVAIHNRALTPSQIQQNFAVGVGEKYYLLFSIAHLVSVPQSYILFEVSQYDSYGYLFNKPVFISLDPAATPGTIAVAGMRIGANGVEFPVGQAYRTLDITLTDSLYTPGVGQPLSTIGTVVPLQKGPADDLFFLCFDRLGSNAQVCSQDAQAVAAAPVYTQRPSDIGVKTFEEISASMSAITGVSATVPSVRNTYLTVKQQLPTVENIQAFVGAHQVGIAQMAIAYCSALVDDQTKRIQFWNGIDPLGLNVNTSASQVIDPIVERVLGLNLTSQPDPAAVRGELSSLISGQLCTSVCSGMQRTAVVVKATCAAALGSAVTVVQ